MMVIARVVAVAGCLFTLASALQASTFSRAGHAPVLGAAPLIEGGQCGGDFLTQSSLQTIVPGNSISCNVDGSVHVENSYYRVYDLSAYPLGFNLCSVEIGIQSASAPSGTQPVTLNLYAHTGAAFPGGTRSLIGSSPLSITNQAGTVLSVPVTHYVPAGTDLVLEVLTPSGEAQGNSFFIGSNAANETAPSYLRAPNCGVAQPATTLASGFPGMHFVLNARGDAAAGAPVVSAIPVVTEFGSVEIGETATRTVQLSNIGSSELVIASFASPPQPFTVVSDDCSGHALQPDMGCDIVFAFSPLSGDSVSTTLAVTSNAAAASIDLHGTGLLAMPLPGPGVPWLIGMMLVLLMMAARRLAKP